MGNSRPALKADIVVLRERDTDPTQSVMKTHLQDVQMVWIGGAPVREQGHPRQGQARPSPKGSEAIRNLAEFATLKAKGLLAAAPLSSMGRLRGHRVPADRSGGGQADLVPAVILTQTFFCEPYTSIGSH